MTLGSWSQAQAVTGTDAERSLAQYQASVHQIKIINTHSQSQSAIGTGFFVAEGHLLATNYHVIASVIHEPGQYSAVIEFNGDKHTLEVVAVDVIHDLAILSVPVQGPPLGLSEDEPARGARLFAMGNPLNIGMTLVEGNYNGLVDDRFFDQIHFSGAINAGMSGGPALSHIGQVVGINVASAGNQVGFLVPADKLRHLLEQARMAVDQKNINNTTASSGPDEALTTGLQQEVGRQLQQATHSMIEQIMAEPWPVETLGDAIVIGQMHGAVDCWGASDEDAEKKLISARKGCNSRDGLFISPQLQSGYIEYEFSYQKAEDWPPVSLYQHANQMLSHYRPGNRAGKKEVDNYTCLDRVVARTRDGFKRQMVYCTRPYIHYPELFDTLYVAASLDSEDTVLIEHFTLSGVTRADGDRFLARFIEQVAWQ